MPRVVSLKCRECGRTYPISPIYACDFCFAPLEPEYDYEAIAKSGLLVVDTRNALKRYDAPTIFRL